MNLPPRSTGVHRQLCACRTLERVCFDKQVKVLVCTQVEQRWKGPEIVEAM